MDNFFKGLKILNINNKTKHSTFSIKFMETEIRVLNVQWFKLEKRHRDRLLKLGWHRHVFDDWPIFKFIN